MVVFLTVGIPLTTAVAWTFTALALVTLAVTANRETSWGG